MDSAPPPINRIQQNVLAVAERRLLTWICARLPMWVTPDLLTGIGVAGAGVIFAGYALSDRSPGWLWLAIVGFVIQWFGDSLDGSLARYRKQPSALGALLDKITDGASLATLGFCLGYRAWLDGHGVLHLLAGAFIGAAYLLRCYMYWVVAYLERDRAAAATVGPLAMRPFGELSFAERLRYYLGQSWRIVLFGEGDVYFWVGLALVLGRVGDVVLLLAATMAFWLVVIGGKRIGAAIRLDREGVTP